VNAPTTAASLLDARISRDYDRNKALRDAAPEMLAICREFVRRVELGEVRSKRTYAAMKAVIDRVDGE
jgi:hypothetical protein